MEYSGKKRSNLMLVVIMWLLMSGYFFLKAMPNQFPLRMMPSLEFYRYSLIYSVFSLGILIMGFILRDRPLLIGYACCSLVILLMLMCRETVIEKELLAKIRDHAVAFFVLPHWGWTRVLEEKGQGVIAGWCALSGAAAFFASRFARK